MEKITEEILDESLQVKNVSLESCEEQKNVSVRDRYEETLLLLEAAIKKEPVNEEFLSTLSLLKQQHDQQVKIFEKEIDYLNEKFQSQSLMFSDSVAHIHKLEEDIRGLKNKSIKED